MVMCKYNDDSFLGLRERPSIYTVKLLLTLHPVGRDVS